MKIRIWLHNHFIFLARHQETTKVVFLIIVNDVYDGHHFMNGGKGKPMHKDAFLTHNVWYQLTVVNYSKDDIFFMKVEIIFIIIERRIFTKIVKFMIQNYMFCAWRDFKKSLWWVCIS